MNLKQNIWLMDTIALLQGMVFYGPIATRYRQTAGLSIFQITLIESISLVICLALELPWGIVADKIGYRKTMIVCCALYFLSKIIFWQAREFAGFLLERIVLSITMAGLSGVDASILYLSSAEGRSQKAFGIYNSLQTTGLLLASFLYSFLIRDNYRLAAFLTAICYGAAALLSFGLKEVKPDGKMPSPAPAGFLLLLKRMFQNKRFLLFLVGVAFLNETHQTVTVFLNQLQYVKCGLSNAGIGYAYIGATVAGLSGAGSARITRRLGTMWSASIFYGTSAAACIVLAVTRNAWLSVAAIVLLRISFSLFQPLQTDLQSKSVTTQDRATELSVNAVLIDCVGVGTNLVYGKLADTHLPAALFTGAALCLAGYAGFCIWFAGRRSVVTGEKMPKNKAGE